MPTLTSHRQQPPPPLPQLQQHQRPTISKEHMTAVAPPRPPSSPPRPMTPTSAPAVRPSAPASPPPDTRPRSKSSQAKTALHPSTPPRLEPLMSRHVAEVVSPQPRRVVARTPLSPGTSAHLTLSPGINGALAPPCHDPPKKSREVAAKRPPTPPKPRGSGKNPPDTDQDQDQSHDRDTPGPRGRSYNHHMDGPSLGQTRSSGASAASRPAGQSTLASNHHGESRPSSMALARRHSTMSVPSSPSREQVSHRRLANGSPHRTQLDNLTDAIVAGSLASARLTPHNTGPASLAPPPLPKRQKSPRLLHTLRQPHNLLDEEEEQHNKKGHRALLRKGKHAHHEGSRKKWREEIRPRERKRYEALWASNRGLLLTDTRLMSPATSISSDLDRDVSQCVANVVVREVWKRSRLPDDELAEIYDLVDRSRSGMLSRAEFVVGTWLVDQRLKGRKVPAKVTDSVWGSANGVRVKGPNGK
ncbi:hypothetical protein J3F83DRAFT_743236 [Trichoderma novae-zelandiae]